MIIIIVFFYNYFISNLLYFLINYITFYLSKVIPRIPQNQRSPQIQENAIKDEYLAHFKKRRFLLKSKSVSKSPQIQESATKNEYLTHFKKKWRVSFKPQSVPRSPQGSVIKNVCPTSKPILRSPQNQEVRSDEPYISRCPWTQDDSLRCKCIWEDLPRYEYQWNQESATQDESSLLDPVWRIQKETQDESLILDLRALSISGSFNQENVTNSEPLIPEPCASKYLSEKETATDYKSISESGVIEFSLLPRNLLDEKSPMNDKPCASERLSREGTAANSESLMLNRLISNNSSNQGTPMRKQCTSIEISLLTNQYPSTKQRAVFISDFSIKKLLSKKTTSTVSEDFIDVERRTLSENSSNSEITKHEKNDACTCDNPPSSVRKNFYFTFFLYNFFWYLHTFIILCLYK